MNNIEIIRSRRRTISIEVKSSGLIIVRAPLFCSSFRIKAFLKENGSPEKVELLPYHKLGEAKRHALGKEPFLFSPPTDEKLEELKAIFADL